ncbi:unnamed protein product [Chrysoparadoxa australica]
MAGDAAKMEDEPSHVTEAYGLVGYIASLLGWLLFLIWAYVPDEYFHQWGVTYYPSKYWALAIPAYIITVVPLVVLMIIGSNMLTTAPLESRDTITDPYSIPAPTDSGSQVTAHMVPDMYDLDIGHITDLLVAGDSD